MTSIGIDIGSPMFSPAHSGHHSPNYPYSPQMVAYKPNYITNDRQDVFNFKNTGSGVGTMNALPKP